MDKKQSWYVVNVHSGKEQFVVSEIKKMVKTLKLQKLVGDTYIPQQKKVVVTKKGKDIRQERLFPGYILVKMVYSDEAANLLTGIEQIRGFVRSGDRVFPLGDEEVQKLMDNVDQKAQTYKITLKTNDAVKIIDGTFKDFIGKVQDVNESKGEVTILITMFGRETPRVEKIENVVKL